MKPRLLYLSAEDSFFCSHRLPLARAAKEAGFDVWVAARVTGHAEPITRAGLGLEPIAFSRSGFNPISEYRCLRDLITLYRRLQPDIVHHIALKPVVYGTWAARCAGIPRVVNALTGMGYVFGSEQPLARALRGPVRLALWFLLDRPNHRVIVQNEDDRRLIAQASGMAAGRVALIRGSGVDLARFRFLPEPGGAPRVVLIGRMLWSKGVGDFIEAARILRSGKTEARFALVGAPDEGNPEFIPPERLDAWKEEGIIESWGHRDDVADVWAESHIAVLPSFYREGVPKSLIEAAACGRPIVTTDSPGCRDVVKDGENGFLVPARDPAAVAEALRKLIENPGLRRRMGEAGRRRAEELFSEEKVIRETLAVYRSLLGEARLP